MTAPLTRIALSVPAAAADAFEAALESVCLSVSRFAGDGESARAGAALDEARAVRLEGLRAGEADRGVLDLALAIAAAAADIAVPPVEIGTIAQKDWEAASRADFPPLRIGRYVIHASDSAKPLPAGAIGLEVDAGLAFGSGRHGSTAGCLLALDALARRRFHAPLDLGCGSGILAIAMAKTWAVPVLAADIDRDALAVVRDNARANGVGPRVRAIQADGCRAPAVRVSAPFDLIAANILASPLKRMAGDIAACLAPGGRLVLSGFVGSEGRGVLSAYRRHGLRLAGGRMVEGWLTLVLGRRRPAVAQGRP